MKEFRVGFWYEESGYVIVDAKNKEDARIKVDRLLDDFGIDGIAGQTSMYDISHRDWKIEEVEAENG